MLHARLGRDSVVRRCVDPEELNERHNRGRGNAKGELVEVHTRSNEDIHMVKERNTYIYGLSKRHTGSKEERQMVEEKCTYDRRK